MILNHQLGDRKLVSNQFKKNEWLVQRDFFLLLLLLGYVQFQRGGFIEFLDNTVSLVS